MLHVLESICGGLKQELRPHEKAGGLGTQLRAAWKVHC